MGFVAGIPTALIAGLWFGKRISKKIFIAAPEEIEEENHPELPPIAQTLLIIGLPIVLILLNTIIAAGTFGITNPMVLNIIALIGHPFSALIIANLLAWYFFGLRKGFTKDQLLKISTKSLAPAGTIILLTGAGGVFKQVLTDTGAGELLATSLSNAGVSILAFAFISAAIVRIVQGSSTVAMITAAGLVSPLLASTSLNSIELACMVIAIASGASIFSHVNDSGFWLVGQYLGITEKQTFRSWTVMTTILA
ncbi:GntP family permease [Flagellimonas lutimaris]|uniref:GntP family permease n=1 Tax=Flagellimonas lutimaris TaxID=475082 RepID=UPI003F5CC65A